MPDKGIEPMSQEAARARRPRSLVIALVLAAIAVAVFVLTIERFGAQLAGGA